MENVFSVVQSCLFPHELGLLWLRATEIHGDDFGQKEQLYYKGLREHTAGMNPMPGMQLGPRDELEPGIQTALEIALRILL